MLNAVTYQISKEHYRYNEAKTSICLDITNYKGWKLPHPLSLPVKQTIVKEFEHFAHITIPKRLLNNNLFKIIGEEVLSV